MKKIALISTFCDTEEKQNILKENIIKIKELGIDVMAISPIEIPYDITKLCDFFFYTKENPLLRWPERAHTQWYRMPISENRITEIHRAFYDYGWAALYQTKKLSQLALTFDYDIFYHLIYDLEIDDIIKSELKSNEVNFVHPRINPHHPDILWEATLHFMVFDRLMMENIINEITLEGYLETNGVAEDELKKWIKKFNIQVSKHPVKDKIFYWENVDFFDFSPFPEFKLFLSKNEKTHCWLGESPNEYSSDLTDNLRMVFYSFEHMGEIKININGVEYIENPKPWEYIEFPIISQNINEMSFTYNNRTIDFTENYNDIMMNQIYYNHRP